MIGSGDGRKRLLFFAEAVTLAHIARPIALADQLATERYEIHLAADGRYDRLLPALNASRHPLASIPTEQFAEALAQGKPVYDSATLERYVDEDLALIDAIRPDLVIGDFRLSLAVSAALRGVRYYTISNAYWGCYSRLGYPLPEHPLADTLGLKAAQALFTLARPFAFALHARPLNRVRRRHGLPSLGPTLCAVYTHADRVLNADIPGLVPVRALPDHHHTIGPLSWSPAIPLPAWWESLPNDRPIVYVNLGSSGDASLLGPTLEALAKASVTVIAATLGAPVPADLPPHVHLTDFLPGDRASASASAVLCNGGSPTTQQALLAGVPVIGIASNMDQHLNMRAVEAAGAGLCLRAGQISGAAIGDALQRLLDTPTFAHNARRLQRACHAHPAPAQILHELIEKDLGR